MNGHYSRKLNILSIEDNPSDMAMIKLAFQSATIPLELYFVADGVEAMEFLLQHGRHPQAPRPDLILLDLNLPLRDGRQVLKEIRQTPQLSCIPVIVLSTSHKHEDIHCSYQLHANSYYTKPTELSDFDQMAVSIKDNWLKLVKLPDFPVAHRLYPV